MIIPEQAVRELLPLLRQFCIGPYAIALGGSHAKGISDLLSDLDVYLFASQVISGPRRTELVEETLREMPQAISWGTDEPFVETGTDFWYHGSRVEVWLRNSHHVEDTIAACRQGLIRRDDTIWTVMGFFSYTVLADVQAMQLVEDPYGMLSRWKVEVQQFPEALRSAIVRRFSREAAFWPRNLHYLSAVERGDIIYTSGVVQRVLHALIQVAFALSQQYFPGEKRLDLMLEQLPVQPLAFSERVQALLSPRGDARRDTLREQQRELTALVDEMEQLVLDHGRTPSKTS